MQNVQDFIDALNVAIDSRAAYEATKANDFSDYAKEFRKSNNAVIAEKLLQCSVDANFMNRQERANNRYNVYAARKVFNAAHAATASAEINHFSIALLRAALAFEKIESKLTHADAVAACSASVKH